MAIQEEIIRISSPNLRDSDSFFENEAESDAERLLDADGVMIGVLAMPVVELDPELVGAVEAGEMCGNFCAR